MESEFKLYPYNFPTTFYGKFIIMNICSIDLVHPNLDSQCFFHVLPTLENHFLGCRMPLFFTVLVAGSLGNPHYCRTPHLQVFFLRAQSPSQEAHCISITTDPQQLPRTQRPTNVAQRNCPSRRSLLQVCGSFWQSKKGVADRIKAVPLLAR